MPKVYAPASIGNVGVGFDSLGVAVSPIDGTFLGDFVRIEGSNKLLFQNIGKFSNTLPSKIEQNIVYKCWQRFCYFIGKFVPVHVTLEKNTPVSSGIGSSACSVVATLVALNVYCGNPLSKEQIFLLMGEMEGLLSGESHFDNIAPSLYGGMQLIIKENCLFSQKIPIFNHWLWIIAYPGIKISTIDSRAILPTYYKLSDCISHGRNFAGFIHACHTKQPMLAAKLIKDIIAEPYRKKILYGFTNARNHLLNLGAIACGISGSGPTLFSICEHKHIAIDIADWLTKYYLKNDTGFVYICKLDIDGARIIMD